MPIKRGHKERRRAERNARKSIPAQPAGWPQGKHLTGIKGTKASDPCYCGGCLPKALARGDKIRVFS